MNPAFLVRLLQEIEEVQFIKEEREQYPEWTAALFDEHFLRILGRLHRGQDALDDDGNVDAGP